jgi:hypothetical protein
MIERLVHGQNLSAAANAKLGPKKKILYTAHPDIDALSAVFVHALACCGQEIGDRAHNPVPLDLLRINHYRGNKIGTPGK